MDKMAPLPPGKTNFERLIAALRRKDPALNEYATEILRRVGKPAVPLLVREAVVRGKQPDHRIRILDVIQRIGEPLDEAFFDLTMLLGHPVERVREKAAEVIAALSPAGRSSFGATEVLAPAVLALMGGGWPTRTSRRRRSPPNDPGEVLRPPEDPRHDGEKGQG